MQNLDDSLYTNSVYADSKVRKEINKRRTKVVKREESLNFETLNTF